MSPEEFILWLTGFTEGVHEFNVSPKQWEHLKDKLATVTVKEDRTTLAKQLLRDSSTHYNYILKEKDGNLQ